MIVFNALSVFWRGSAVALFSNLSKGVEWPIYAEWPIYLAGTFCIVISVYQTISFILALSLRMRIKRGKDQRELDSPGEVPALRAADTSQFVRPPSVTENTTELLERKKI